MLDDRVQSRWQGRLLFTAVFASIGVLVWAVAISDGSRIAWFASRSAGITAYLLLGLSTVTGLLTSSRLLFRWVKPPPFLELHKVFSFIGLTALGIHGFALLFDRFVTYSIWQILVPFLSEYRPVEVSIGIFSGYLMVIVTVSFYVKKQIGGPKVWRALHYGGFVAFGLGTLHGILSGTDSGTPWMVGVYVTLIALVLFLTYVRILGGRYIPRRRSRPQGS